MKEERRGDGDEERSPHAARRDQQIKAGQLGRMRPPGLVVFEGRDLKRAQLYSYERKTSKLDAELEKRLKANRKAWEFFQAQPPGYQKIISWWIISAKQKETRFRRLERLIKDSENGRRVGILERKKK